MEPRLRALLEGWGRGCIVLAYVISVSPPSLSTEKAMALESAGPKFRPYSDVRCCAVVIGSGNEYFCLPSFIVHTVIYLYRLGEFYSLDSVLL